MPHPMRDPIMAYLDEKTAMIAEDSSPTSTNICQELIQFELIEEIAAIKAMLEHDDFETRFKSRCTHRALQNNATSLSFFAMPTGTCNTMYWDIAAMVFQPRTMHHMLALLFPHIRTHVHYTTHIGRSKRLFSCLLFEEKKMDTLGIPYRLESLAHLVMTDRHLLNIRPLLDIRTDLHPAFHEALESIYPGLADALVASPRFPNAIVERALPKITGWLHPLIPYPDRLEEVLAVLPDALHFALVTNKNPFGFTLLDYEQTPESLKIILLSLPPSTRLQALKERHQLGQKLFQGRLSPHQLSIILEHCPAASSIVETQKQFATLFISTFSETTIPVMKNMLTIMTLPNKTAPYGALFSAAKEEINSRERAFTKHSLLKPAPMPELETAICRIMASDDFLLDGRGVERITALLIEHNRVTHDSHSALCSL